MLEDHAPEAFNAYLDMIYTGAVVRASPAYDHDDKDQHQTEDQAASRCFDLLVDTYILSTHLGDLQSCNTLSDRLIIESHIRGIYPSIVLANKVWSCTPTKSPLRRLFVAFSVQDTEARSLRMLMDDPSPESEFMRVVARRFSQVLKSYYVGEVLELRTFRMRRCAFHVHDGMLPVGEKCEEALELDT